MIMHGRAPVNGPAAQGATRRDGRSMMNGSDSSTARGASPEPPARASIAVIGAGIVGNCLVGHLAELGWRDLVLIDKGPLPNPGGSTGHASNFIFPTDHNREIAMLTLESQRQYAALGVNTTCGGIEVARTEARMEELRRRMTSARVWGIEAELLSPEEIVDEGALREPRRRPRRLLHAERVGGRLGTGGHDHARAGAGEGRAHGAGRHRGRRARGDPPVLRPSRVSAPWRPTRGTIAVEQVVIACGVWSPRLAAMAGATIPLTPAVHQMADLGPIDLLHRTGNEIAYPIVRDMDTFMYERQSHDAMEVGSYAHRPDPRASRRHSVAGRGRALAHRAAVHRRRLRAPARTAPARSWASCSPGPRCGTR